MPCSTLHAHALQYINVNYNAIDLVEKGWLAQQTYVSVAHSLFCQARIFSGVVPI
jgi:hypothetical protein